MSKRTRLAATLATAVAVVALITTGALAASRTGAPTYTFQDSGTIFASINNANAKGTQFTSGNVFSRHFGHCAITYDLSLLPSNAPGTISVKATRVVLYTTRGSLSGTGTATLVIHGDTQQITKGTLSLDHGAGSMKGYTYDGTFTGLANLQTNKIRFDFNATLSN
ncbi:MAG TPA: hypothetical protein VFN55_10270 [Solirubrobacteraceae bacterium]|nr:hypothetical protein [Solirubrobacteraceae bacterium]